MTVAEVIDRFARHRFEYGAADCCAFVGACLEAAGKINPMRKIEYTNEDDARAIIAMYGSLSHAVTAYMGSPLESPEQAEVDDVVLCHAGGEQIVGTVQRVNGERRCLLRTEDGVIDWPLRRAVRAWRAHG